jgi:hypothetical protein
MLGKRGCGPMVRPHWPASVIFSNATCFQTTPCPSFTWRTDDTAPLNAKRFVFEPVADQARQNFDVTSQALVTPFRCVMGIILAITTRQISCGLTTLTDSVPRFWKRPTFDVLMDTTIGNPINSPEIRSGWPGPDAIRNVFGVYTFSKSRSGWDLTMRSRNAFVFAWFGTRFIFASFYS